jgi:hypothetical protein
VNGNLVLVPELQYRIHSRKGFRIQNTIQNQIALASLILVTNLKTKTRTFIQTHTTTSNKHEPHLHYFVARSVWSCLLCPRISATPSCRCVHAMLKQEYRSRIYRLYCRNGRLLLGDTAPSQRCNFHWYSRIRRLQTRR